MSKWENHRTKTEYDDALILKLFAFEFVNSYTSLFYLSYFRNVNFKTIITKSLEQIILDSDPGQRFFLKIKILF